MYGRKVQHDRPVIQPWLAQEGTMRSAGCPMTDHRDGNPYPCPVPWQSAAGTSWNSSRGGGARTGWGPTPRRAGGVRFSSGGSARPGLLPCPEGESPKFLHQQQLVQQQQFPARPPRPYVGSHLTKEQVWSRVQSEERQFRLSRGGQRRRPGQGLRVEGLEVHRGPGAPGGQRSRGWQGKRVFEGEIIQTGNKNEGYNGLTGCQEGVKVPDKKAKLTPTINKSKKESIIETVNVLATKVKLERKIEENTNLQTQLKHKNNKIASLEVKVLELEQHKSKGTENSDYNKRDGWDWCQISKELVTINEKNEKCDALILKLDGKFNKRKGEQAKIKKDLESFKSSLLYIALSSGDYLNEDKLSGVKKLDNIKSKMLELKEAFVILRNLLSLEI